MCVTAQLVVEYFNLMVTRPLPLAPQVIQQESDNIVEHETQNQSHVALVDLVNYGRGERLEIHCGQGNSVRF